MFRVSAGARGLGFTLGCPHLFGREPHHFTGKSSRNLQPLPLGEISCFPPLFLETFGKWDLGHKRPPREFLEDTCLTVVGISQGFGPLSCSVQKGGVPVLTHCRLSRDIAFSHVAHFSLHLTLILYLNSRSDLITPFLKSLHDFPFHFYVSFGAPRPSHLSDLISHHPSLTHPLLILRHQAHCCLGAFFFN